MKAIRKAKTFKCDYCHDRINYEDVGGNPYKDAGKPICDDCHREHFQLHCPLCEDYFDKNESDTPEKYYFVIMPQDVKEARMRSGIYRGKSFPIWISDMFNVAIQKDNVELVMPLGEDILDNADEHTNEICSDCFTKYTDSKWLKWEKENFLIGELIKSMRKDFGKIIHKHRGNLALFNRMLAPTLKSLQRSITIRRTKQRNRVEELKNKSFVLKKVA